jgi:carboxymethylenebutenolidase
MMDCPMLALFAERDPAISSDRVEQLRQTLEQTGGAHQVVLYPDVESGFFDDSRPTFHPVAAADAWTRALAFLNEQLEVKPPTPHEPFQPGTVY